MRIVIPTMVNYTPPPGWKVVSNLQLGDGNFEVTLEPSEFPSVKPEPERVATLSGSVTSYITRQRDLSTVKG